MSGGGSSCQLMILDLRQNIDRHSFTSVSHIDANSERLVFFRLADHMKAQSHDPMDADPIEMF